MAGIHKEMSERHFDVSHGGTRGENSSKYLNAIYTPHIKAEAQPAPDDLDVILAKVKPMETVDQVLARYEQDGGRVSGYAAELALADEILARIKV